MEPYKAKSRPITYKLDKDTIKLLGQANMYYIEYKESNDSIKEVKNLKKMLDYATEELKGKDFSIEMINSMHKILLSGVRGKDKAPGKIRTIQNYINISVW